MKNQQFETGNNKTKISIQDILKKNPSIIYSCEGLVQPKKETGCEEYKKLIEIFDKQLAEDFKTYNKANKPAHEDNVLKDNLNRANAIIRELTDKLNERKTISSDTGSDDNGNAGYAELSSIPAKLSTDTLDIEPIIIRPEEKREGIFNDVNLTEDYELGLRFFQLGLKSGFFNVKLDSDKNSTRVSTAEFFPNKFWPAVKQRSRWIAGICLQNWKAHKWNGSLTTKYFLFRDRKPLISFWSTFLSNFILLYFIYLAIGTIFNFDNSLISGKIPAALWYLMIFNLVFMVSKGVHRFIFTYSWYGFSYALASIFRLGLDSFINFFAIIRSVSVYQKTKKKVVWDATTHY